MVSKDQFLIVVSVLEGRKFPKRPKHKLILEARFDGDILGTDPVDHVDSPNFTQELAWQVDKKGLHQHRLQRASIKLQCYAVDMLSTVKEPIGYVVLDIRSATSTQTKKWLPLLHGKYSRSKPEVCVSIYIDDDKTEGTVGFKAKGAPARRGQYPAENSDSQESAFDPKSLTPILNDEEGFYQIGPMEKCSEYFILSVTIAFAANLPQLIPTNVALPADANGYFFYYSLLGNDVTNEAFLDLLNPTFPAERASVRLRTSTEALQLFLASQPGIEVHLCCGDQSLGSAEIPLKSLLKKGSTEIYMKPVSIEGTFQLSPPNRLKQHLVAMADDIKPVVGVSVVLRKEDQAMSVTPLKDPPPQLERPATPPREKTTQPHSPPEKLPKSAEKSRERHASETGSYTDNFETEKTEDDISSFGEERDKEEVGKKGKKREKAKTSEAASRDATPPPTVPSGQGPASESQHPAPSQPKQRQHHNVVEEPHSESVSAPHVAVPPQAHHFCFTADLRSITNTELPGPRNLYLRYTYPFFGSAAPILTQPPVEVRKGMEVILPQSFCAFNFAASPQLLRDTFIRVPLVVETWDRDRQRSTDSLQGVSQIPLAKLLAASKGRIMNADGGGGWRQMISEEIPILAADGTGPDKVLAHIHCVLGLDDLGPIASRTVQPEAPQEIQQPAPSQPGARPPPPQPSPPPPPEPRETAEYQAALELEMWKENQEHHFESQMREKEVVHMQQLAEEWKKRDREREVLVKKKLAEYSHLEQQLRRTINDLEKRDRQLSANEQEVMRLRSDLEREHGRKLTEMREASQRLQEDFSHRQELERAKVRDLEEYIVKLKQQLQEAEARYQNVEKEFSVYKEQASGKPEVRLQSEINLLTLEKAELERKLETTITSKVHYKQQWGRALKELASFKQREQASARAQLKKKQQEIEHMRLRYLAAEEKELVQAEKKELEEIKHELGRLKVQEQQPHRSQDKQPQVDPSISTSTKSSHHSPEFQEPPVDISMEEDHITRLIEERDTLLRTGVYTNDDRIIVELDRQIREAIARRGVR